ncbi:hypothetical protein NE237_003760 [Protea cynaroides]|uniref:Exostosin GT47 domain-containing protein n=1 Tax=Protea cynaroides TaxID=273540 RepID=A0A9Q0KHP2_9MAGN|nr:hypothetical protein NE237_003760 [Protea cynaroides]
MSHRQLIRAKHQMDKSNVIRKCRNHLWCVIFSSILFWFFLFYIYSSDLTSRKNVVRPLQNDYSIGVLSQEPNSLRETENDSETNTPPKSTENRVQPNTEEGDLINVQQLQKKDPEIKSSNIRTIADEGQTLSEDAEPEIRPLLTKTEDQSLTTEEKVELIHEPAITEQVGNPQSTVEARQLKRDEIQSAVSRLKPTSNDEEEEIPVEAREEKNVVEPVNRTWSNPISAKEKIEPVNQQSKPKSDMCSGRYVYVHRLPRQFNDDILKECRKISMWTDMCRFTTNMGLGPPIGNSRGVFTNRGWYATNQFALDVIFSNRMKQYKCLTDDSSMASAIFVPFYAGFDISRYLWDFNISMRDSASLALVKWLTRRPEWKVLGGRDHFLVAGRISWDLNRLTDEESDWGNKFLQLDEAKNMTTLVIESSPWTGNDFAIPYPTYFHPSRDIEVFQWQNRMKRLKRRYLFSFAGAPRPGLSKSIRGQIIDQCLASRRKCKMLECYNKSNKCNNPSNVMKLFQSSIFCLQPSGDSYTRRSAFDSILAGCIPVFFHPGSAYVQYIWHLPKNYTTYSVLISEIEVREGKVDIEKRLLRIPKVQVIAMRQQVIRLIPKVIYADPRSRLETLEDAFDLAVQGVIKKVDRARKAIRDGVDPDAGYAEANSWKYNLFGTEAPHEWDPFFSKPKRTIS